jgi:hypothetical protein
MVVSERCVRINARQDLPDEVRARWWQGESEMSLIPPIDLKMAEGVIG